MNMELVIPSSTNKNTKLDERIEHKHTISFGDSAYQDFTKHTDTERKERYIDRHNQLTTLG